jgi:hypothetical protein
MTHSFRLHNKTKKNVEKNRITFQKKLFKLKPDYSV